MRKLNTFTLCFFFHFAALAQQHDKVWLFGYGGESGNPDFGGSVIDFATDPPDIYYQTTGMDMDMANASVCDSLGNLLFYSNGLYINNHLHEKMPGSDTLNPGDISDDFYDIGYPLPQGLLILPLPGSDSLYYLFHERILLPDPSVGLNDYHVDVLFYTIVDISMNGGEGGIVEKRKEALVDTLALGKITATRHANGIDWWIMVREYRAQRYHRFLLTAEGVEYVGNQAIGIAPYSLQVLGQMVFSPDGSKLVRYGVFTKEIGNYLDIFDFDRCTGLLDGPLFENIIDSAGSAGAAISPSSQYLYLPSGNYIYQYDLWAGNILSTKDTVAVYDGSLSPFPTRFFMAQLAPDGKIYINSPNGNDVLHVIHRPNLPGDSCMVEQNGVALPTYNSFSMPNFPNYRLGALEGWSEACDTTVSSTEAIFTDNDARTLLFPNPASGKTKIVIPKSHSPRNCWAVFWDTYGRQKLKVRLFSEWNEINLVSFSSGIYFYEVKDGEVELGSGKLVVE